MDPYGKPVRVEDPFVRKLTITLEDNFLKKTVKISHEIGKEPDMREVKKDIQAKLGVLFDTVYK